MLIRPLKHKTQLLPNPFVRELFTFKRAWSDVEKWTKYRFDGESWVELEDCRKFSSSLVARTFHPANGSTFTRAKCCFIISCYSRCVADNETFLAHKYMSLCKRSSLRGWKSNNHSTEASNGEQTTSHDLPLLYWHGMEILWVILCKHIFHFILSIPWTELSLNKQGEVKKKMKKLIKLIRRFGRIPVTIHRLSPARNSQLPSNPAAYLATSL